MLLHRQNSRRFAKFNVREIHNNEVIAKLNSREILIPAPKKSIFAEIMESTKKKIIILQLFAKFAKFKSAK